MIDVIEEHIKESNRYTQSQLEPKTFPKTNPTRRIAEGNNGVYLVLTYPATTLERMTRILQFHKTESNNLDISKALTGFEHSLYRVFKIRALAVL